MSVTALVPLKALAQAKGRLAGALDADDRREFVAWMARRVVAACAACTLIDDVIVIAGDEDAAGVGRDAGAGVLLVPRPGLQHAMDTADAATAGRTTTIVVAADLPQLTTEDLVVVISSGAGDAAARVVVAPTHDGGTGALLRTPPTVIRTAYGIGSAQAHMDLARAAGVPFTVVQRPGTANDVDTPAELPAPLAWRDDEAVRSALPPRRTEESACRKAP